MPDPRRLEKLLPKPRELDGGQPAGPERVIRVMAPDAGRADVEAVTAVVRQLQGRRMDLVLGVRPMCLNVEAHVPERQSRLVAALLQPLYPGTQLVEPAAEAEAPGVATVNLTLARPPAHPLAVSDSFSQNDPVAVLGGAARELEPGERLESRLTLASGRPVTWRPPVNNGQYITPFGRILTTLSGVTGLWLGLIAMLAGIGAAYTESLWLGLLALVIGGLCGITLWETYQTLCWQYDLPGPDLEQVKSRDTLFEVALTFTARAATPERAQELLNAWQARYGIFGGANRWVVRPASGWRLFLEGPRPIYLSASEIAQLWHLPVDVLQSPFSARQGHQPLMPPPMLLDLPRLDIPYFPLGTYLDGAQRRVVYAPVDLLHHHMLALGKTQTGKTRLIECLCEAVLDQPDHSLLVLDPHSSLVQRLAGKVPADRQANTMVWDLGRTDQPVPLNLLAAPGADTNPNAIADELVEMFRTLWADSWGARLQYHLGYLIRILLAARLADLPTGPGQHPFTLLNVQSFITDADFRNAVLSLVTDPDLLRYVRTEFKALLDEPRLFLEVFMPILNKAGAYAQREPARHIVGQFGFTPMLERVMMEPGCVLMDLAPSVVGSDTARLVASTVLLSVRQMVAQRQLQPRRRYPRLTVVLDEAQWHHPGPLERWMAEFTKFGVNLVIITQSLELMDAADPQLRPQVLANVDNLFVFGLMADDAARIAPQFDAEVQVNDLLNLPPRYCYAKVVATGWRQPTFSFETQTVKDGDPVLAEWLTAETTDRWGTRLDAIRQTWARRQQALAALKKTRVNTTRPVDEA